MDFSLTFLGSDSSLLVTDAIGSVSIVTVSSSLNITEKTQIALPADEGVACWSVYGASLSEAFIISGSNPNITIVDPSSGAVEGFITLAASDMFGFDSAIDRTHMYTLANTANIAVTDLAAKPPKEIQNFDLSSVGNRKDRQGMAVYSSA